MKFRPATNLALAALLLLLPQAWGSQLGLLIAIAIGTTLLLLSAYRSLASWLILLALGLSLAPGLDCVLVLGLRRMGLPEYLTGTPLSPQTQVDAVLVQVALLTFVFCLTLVAGWLLALPPSPLRAGGARKPLPLSLPARVVALGVWLFCMLSFFQQMGGTTILRVQYGSAVGHALVQSGMYAVLANLSLLVLDISAWGRRNSLFLALLWFAESVSFLLLGNRVDVLFALLTILLVHVEGFRAQFRVVATAAVVLVPFFMFWGFFRSTASFDLHQESFASFFVSTAVANLPTVGGIGPATLTTADAIYLGRSGKLGYLNGRGYLDYVPRMLPAVLSPDRPESLSLFFQKFDLVTIGGLTPVAEAYLNFGRMGIGLVGLVLGIVLARLESATRASTIPWRYAWYVVAVAISFRTWLYEVFSLYKLCFVFMLFLGFIWCLNRLTSTVAEPVRAARSLPA